MNIDYYFDQVILNDKDLSEYGRKKIIEEIEHRYDLLPLNEKKFDIKKLIYFNDKALIIFLSDMYQLLAINHFINNGRNPYSVTTSLI
jgi:hypothetical protein